MLRIEFAICKVVTHSERRSFVPRYAPLRRRAAPVGTQSCPVPCQTLRVLLASLKRARCVPDGRGFWLGYRESQHELRQFWPRIINAGGDEPTEASRHLRRRMMVQAGMHDPRDGSPDEEPLE